MATRIIRSRPADARRTDEKLSLAKTKLKLIANLTVEIGKMQARLDAASDELLETMRTLRQDSLSVAEATAYVETPSGKSSTVIDPQAFQKAVKPADFWASVSVSVTAARKVLAEKELDKIATVTPGTPGAPRLKVKVAGAK